MSITDKLNIKKTIFEIDPYKPGKSGDKDRNPIKLSANENALGCSPKVAEINFLKDLNRYPDGGAEILRAEIAKKYNRSSEEIICGAGSDEVINMIITAFCKEGDEVIHTEFAFLMYKLYALSHGVIPVSAKEKNLKADIQNILSAVTPKTRIVFIANPNNPTGSFLTKDELTDLRKNLREDILLVIDGAYAEFSEEEDYESGESLSKEFVNVIMLRTFSKIYGLASLRLGYGIGNKELIAIMNRVRGPFNVSRIVQEAGILAINDQEFIKKSITHNNIEKEKIEKALASLKIRTYPSEGNFLLLDLIDGTAADSYLNFLESKDIIVRNMESYGLVGMVRVTIGTTEENKKFIETTKEFIEN